MPPEPLKFRCDQCGQLLGVSAARVGRSVKCPKCGTALVVPDPEATGPPAGESGDPSAVGPDSSAPGLKSSGFFDAIELSQEELRTLFPEDASAPAEARERGGMVQPPPASSVPAGGQGGVSPAMTTPPGVGSTPAPGTVSTPRMPIAIGDEPVPEAIAQIVQDRPRGAEPPSGPSPVPSPSSSMAAEPLAKDESGRPRVSRDVVIPRIAFLAWSLFVLISLFLVFVAGLLVGHFVWVRQG